MKRVRMAELTVVAIVIQMLMLPPVVRVSAFIPEPFELWGVAYDELAVVLPNGAPIRTFVDGVDYSNKTSVFSRPAMQDGYFDVDTGGNYKTNATSSSTPWIKEGADDNESIMYVWGDMSNNTPISGPTVPWLTGRVFKDVHNWQTGLPPQQGDLHAALSTIQPPLIKISSIVTNSTLPPYTDYLYLSNPTPGPVNASAFYLQKDVLNNTSGPIVQPPSTVIPPFGELYVDTGNLSYFVESGDNVRLVWKNPGGIDAPYGGSDIIVDRVEFNATVGGTLYWEPGNTIQNDEPAPPRGYQINRSGTFGDTNSDVRDFYISAERRPNSPPLPPFWICIQGLCNWNIDNRLYHITVLSNFLINWTHRDNDGDPQGWANIYISTLPNGLNKIWTGVVNGPTQSTTYTGPPLLPASNYCLGLQTRDASQWGPIAEMCFRTNGLPPSVNRLAPANGLVGLPAIPDMQVWWTFMNDPDPGDLMNYSWAVSTSPIMMPIIAGGMTTNNHSDPFATNPSTTYYWCVNETDGWQWVNECNAPWQFSTAPPPTPPSVTMTKPSGGEYWQGGSNRLLEWTFDDLDTPLNAMSFYLNYTIGASSFQIAGPLIGILNFSWTLPTIDASGVVVNITAIDAFGLASSDVSGQFGIDSTPPTLLGGIPTAWNVPIGVEIQASFSEPVEAPQGQAELGLGLFDDNAATWVKVNYVGVPAMWPQEIRLLPASPLRACGNYTTIINGTIADRATWTLGGTTTWTFHTVCSPSASFSDSLAGKDWSGGSVHELIWSTGDEIDTHLLAWVNYSEYNGVDDYPNTIYSATSAIGIETYSWTIPILETMTARLRLTVVDSSGLSTIVESAAFTIDSTPPSILSSVPADGSFGVKITGAIEIIFAEPVFHESANQSFSIWPDPGGVSISWRKTMTGKDLMAIAHDPFGQRTDYEVSFGTAIRDDSDPGNHPADALRIRFSTKPPPPTNPPVAKAVGKNQVSVGEPVTFDGSQSMGNITQYVWTITDNQNNIVEVLQGAVVTFTFAQNGRYLVTLRVTDEISGVWDEDSLDVVVTSSVNAGAVMLLSSALIMAAILGGTEVGRIALISLLVVPIHKRKVKGKEDPEIRGMIKAYIMLNPGDTYTSIKQNLKLNDGTLQWHLMKLEKGELIKSKVKGTHRHYYPSDMRLTPEDGGGLHDLQGKLIATVEKEPGKPVKLLAEELGVSSQLALYHLRKLQQRNLVSLERKGLSLRAYPASERNT